eukprot:Plantae.Rhodophyta-Palmaria_palmata.ctg31415.p1 GENE.Plantae.Rhodophyta-Palmaria_palmata.ctg31415~~Plantae.Rhodophyta-Palmaria_palmata.ctg31415.p1  ORF type:complete len:110 (-),score=7.25 Plantae.Rhodophyta-Palmaria_palmata.ctg31415:350-679(-)
MSFECALSVRYEEGKFYCSAGRSLIDEAALNSRDTPRPTSFASEITGYRCRNPAAVAVHSGASLKSGSRFGVQLKSSVNLPCLDPSPTKNAFTSGNTRPRNRRRTEQIR